MDWKQMRRASMKGGLCVLIAWLVTGYLLWFDASDWQAGPGFFGRLWTLLNLPATGVALATRSLGAAFFIMTIQWFAFGTFAALIYQAVRPRKHERK